MVRCATDASSIVEIPGSGQVVYPATRPTSGSKLKPCHTNTIERTKITYQHVHVCNTNTLLFQY